MPQLTYKLELSASAIDSALTDYAAEVGTAALSAAQNTAVFAADTGSGADVWFSSDQAGTLPINAKLKHWSDANSTFAFDVKIASISAVSGAAIYLHVGSKPGGYGTDAYDADTALVMSDDDFTDLTTNGNDGTGAGGITPGGVTGPSGFGPATELDGVDDHINFGDVLDTGTGDFSIECWVYHDNDEDSGNAIIVSKRATSSPAAGYIWWLEDDPGDNTQQFQIQAAGGTIRTENSNTDIGQQSWCHVALTVDRSDVATFYKDGIADGTKDISDFSANISNAVDYMVGRLGTNYYDGRIAGLAQYS
ncbi:MAG: hypothetical protein EBY40_07670, partial [Marivivens sp.]|nr:hypothetical protein [Marivivens sp.]NCW68880.1 hypothetical protein [Marivivens sp.]NDH02992.1 hypothetical protein [Marivivens sp.]